MPVVWVLIGAMFFVGCAMPFIGFWAQTADHREPYYNSNYGRWPAWSGSWANFVKVLRIKGAVLFLVGLAFLILAVVDA